MKLLIIPAISLITILILCLSAALAFVPETGNRLFDERYRIVSAYGDTIETAARQFDIPSQILVGVILSESGGDPWAVTDLSSAKGLMQTIDTTFEMAWKALREQGIHIKKTPFHPESSILAGAWYLDRMYCQAVADGRADAALRHDPAAWRVPLEYYYAGPENGVKTGSRVEICSKGRCRTIDKSAYSARVLRFAGRGPTSFFEAPVMAESLSLSRKKEYRGSRFFPTYERADDKGFD